MNAFRTIFAEIMQQKRAKMDLISKINSKTMSKINYMKIFISQYFTSNICSSKNATLKRKSEPKSFNYLLLVSCFGIAFLSPIDHQAIGGNKPSSYEASVAEPFRQSDSDLIKEWIKGPVRYIASSEEEREYKKLKSDKERLDFIYTFWRKRDPTKLTLINEKRDAFWERIRVANALYNVSVTPGWKTDRGKIYILLGPPDNIEFISNLHSSTISDIKNTSKSGHRGLERWVYHRGKQYKIDPTIVVPFLIDETGEYRLSRNPKHYSKAMPGLVMEVGPDPTASSRIVNVIKEADARNEMIAARFDLGQSIDIASGEKVLEEIVKTVEYFEPIKTKPKINYFIAEDDKTYVLYSIDLDLNNFYEGEMAYDQIIPMAIFGKAISEDGSEYMFSSDKYAPKHIVKEGKEARIMVPFLVPPGEYMIAGGLLEMVSGKIFSFQENINVPDIKEKNLEISNITLAKKIEEKLEPSIIPYGIEIIPKITNEYNNNEEFNVYYQVLGLDLDNQKKKDFDVSYQFYKKHKSQLVEFGEAIVLKNRNFAEQGYSFPLKKLPVGEYALEIVINDNVVRKTTSYLIRFKIK